MRGITVCFVALFVTATIGLENMSSPEARSFAVLVAGARFSTFYRYQANVAHAYQILIKHGVPAENIVVLMFDDAASSDVNPFPGKLFNEPDGPDVYAGIKIDYRRFDLNVNNFVTVLEGNSSATTGGTGRVLKSGPNDNVFVYFSGDGDMGDFYILHEQVTAKALNKTITSMHEKKKYGKLMLYFSHCEATYAVSSSGLDEFSWGTFCDTKIPYICLSDEFSIAWMKNSETADLNKETLNEQFELVKKNTPRSTPQQHGDLSIGKLPVAAFLGNRSRSHDTNRNRVKFIEKYFKKT